jgi:hypothetical protein
MITIIICMMTDPRKVHIPFLLASVAVALKQSAVPDVHTSCSARSSASESVEGVLIVIVIRSQYEGYMC